MLLHALDTQPHLFRPKFTTEEWHELECYDDHQVN